MKASSRLISLLLGLMGTGLTSSAQQSSPGPELGPFWSGTILASRGFEAIAMKGIAVTAGSGEQAYVCYDTDSLGLALAWTGDFLAFGNTLTRIQLPLPPRLRGTPVFGLRKGPGWGKQGSVDDPRPYGDGPLPKDWAHYRGLYVHGDRVILKYTVQQTEFLETPGFENRDDIPVFTRTMQSLQPATELMLVLADGVETVEQKDSFTLAKLDTGRSLGIAATGLPEGARFVLKSQGRLALELPSVAANIPFRLSFSTNAEPAVFDALRDLPIPDLRQWTKGGPARWPQITETQGIRGENDDAYVVDILTEPSANPYLASTFFSAFDFFADGRAALCAFHGDVWVLSGIDHALERLAWRRYATGLFQPLGLKIVDGVVYVLGRDQITRLHDLNQDGEADFYENFNNDLVVTPNFHEFCLDLQTDSQGNFYFGKGTPWEPNVTTEHQGRLFKVAKDGSRSEVVASGLRAPNGLAIGPKDQITVSDNQGHWMPASKINWIEPGGFYGMVPSAHRDLAFVWRGTNFTANPSDPHARRQFRFQGYNINSPVPDKFDRPLCWLPMSADNSTSGQVWVTSNQWGPLQGQLLSMSYGKCALYAFMIDETAGVRQAAVVQFPLRFTTGLMRGRFHPRDGQLYLCGLKGWMTSATRDGAFYRVRYTGRPVHMPSGFHAAKDGLRIGFTSAVDPKTASDASNYSVAAWNYRWTGNYGSPEYSVSDPEIRRRDTLEVRRAQLSPDGRTVWLQLDSLKPADQLMVRYSLSAADGTPMSHEIYATVYQTGPPSKDF